MSANIQGLGQILQMIMQAQGLRNQQQPWSEQMPQGATLGGLPQMPWMQSQRYQQLDGGANPSTLTLADLIRNQQPTMAPQMPPQAMPQARPMSTPGGIGRVLPQSAGLPRKIMI